MTEEKKDGAGVLDSNVPTWLVVVALLGGGTSSYIGLTKDTSDRYHATRAAQDFAVRDAKIERLQAQLSQHLAHSAKYTEIIERQEKELYELHRQIENHVIKHLEGKR